MQVLTRICVFTSSCYASLLLAMHVSFCGDEKTNIPFHLMHTLLEPIIEQEIFFSDSVESETYHDKRLSYQYETGKGHICTV